MDGRDLTDNCIIYGSTSCRLKYRVQLRNPETLIITEILTVSSTSPIVLFIAHRNKSTKNRTTFLTTQPFSNFREIKVDLREQLQSTSTFDYEYRKGEGTWVELTGNGLVKSLKSGLGFRSNHLFDRNGKRARM